MPSLQAMDEQGHLDWYRRTKLLDFIIIAHSDFKFLPETLYLAINIFDRYISCCTGQMYISELRVIACAGLRIAGKYEEILPIPPLDYFLDQCSCSYAGPFIKTECRILSAIGWNLGHPTAESRLRQLCCRLGVEDIKTQNVARFLMEITLFYREFFQYRPSAIAMAALTLARILCGEQARSVYTETDECLEIIGYLHIRLSKAHDLSQILLDKYSDESFSDASTFVLQSPMMDGFFTRIHFAVSRSIPCSHPTMVQGKPAIELATPMVMCSSA